VSCYRSIKGLTESHRPRLTLALINPTDQAEAGRVYRKIAGVCQQFLGWPMEAEPAVQPAEDITETLVMLCRNNKDKSAVATAPQWQIVSEFIGRSAIAPVLNDEAPDASGFERESEIDLEETLMTTETKTFVETQHVADVVIPAAPAIQPTPVAPAPAPAPKIEPAIFGSIAPTVAATIEDDGEITDLPSGETTEAAVLGAVLRKPSQGLIETPIKAPSCPQAILAVNRDRKLVLLAVARQGLSELRAIGQAYRWIIENRPLLAMALPQFSIDTHALPCLRLLVDRTDLSADILQPMLESGNVKVQTYRKLKWGAKTGLLLEAA